MPIPKLLIVVVLGTAILRAEAPPDDAVRRILLHPGLKVAEETLARGHDALVADIVALTEIPAPPFQETRRAAAYLKLLSDAGLSDVEKDAAGNVMGLRKGTGAAGPLVAVAAHLDTVFPEGTDVHVRRNGTRLSAPGIGDDTRALAVLVALVRAMDAAAIHTSSDILFVGDVGEEGAGDLRGVKYLFTKGPYAGRIKTFISMDGAGDGNTIINGAVGSRRYRVTFRGPGGHSYGEFGLVNPAYAMAAAMTKLSALSLPASPRTTFNVGVVGGGTSVNAIPSDAWMDVDLRSESTRELASLEKTFTKIMNDAAAAENATRSTASGPVTVAVTPIGDRPAGVTPRDSALVRTAAAVIRAMGKTPVLTSASTDANIPISLGIPAITIDSGGRGGRAHSLDEWIDVDPETSLSGVDTSLVLILAVAGLD